MSSKAKTQAKPETPVVETPVVETPVVETPVVETPVVETPDELTEEQKLAKLKADANAAKAALEQEIGDAEVEAAFEDAAKLVAVGIKDFDQWQIDGLRAMTQDEDEKRILEKAIELNRLETETDTQGNYPYAPVAEAEGEQEPEFLKQYREAYPLEAEFLVTSDGNVFLAQGRGDALNHARSLGTELKTYKA